jgi:hypothetical protein
LQQPRGLLNWVIERFLDLAVYRLTEEGLLSET